MARIDYDLQLWPRPQKVQYSGPGLTIRKPLRVSIEGELDWLAVAACQAAEVLNRAAGKPIISGRLEGRGPALTIMTFRAAGLRPIDEAGSYACNVSPSGILLAADDSAGIFYGAHTLSRLLDISRTPSLPGVSVRDWPRLALRGAHMYIPARKQLDFFWKLLDMLAGLKYNTLFLEIGGGMELKRHPEINESWKRFCAEAATYDPRKDTKYTESLRHTMPAEHIWGPNALQSSRFFPKNSTHTELAGGEWLTRAEIERIVAECAARHIEIIPEVQSLSHSYWLVTAHPEIAERADDPWPDTYCPSNPRSYELLFDVMDEVIEVFKPRMMHIGHDELVHLCHCPRCKNKNSHRLLAQDVTKIRNFLAGHGIRPIMWGDKLMQLDYGGFARKRIEKGTGRRWHVPATYKAIDMIPRDVIIFDWFWTYSQINKPDAQRMGVEPGFGPAQAKSERYFEKHGFDKIYANFHPLDFGGWEKRGVSPRVLGAEVSSWCEVSAEVFNYNRITSDFFPAADMLWNGREMKRNKACALLARWFPRTIDKLSGESRWIVSGGPGRLAPLDITYAASDLPKDVALKTGKTVKPVVGPVEFTVLANKRGLLEKAIVLSREKSQPATIQVGRKAQRLLFLQGTTMEDARLELTFNSYHVGPAELIRYRVTYTDGKAETFAARHGEHIGSVNGFWPYPYRNWMYSLCNHAVPAPVGKNHKLYVQEWVNPRPESPIDRIEIELGRDATPNGVVLVPAISVLA